MTIGIKTNKTCKQKTSMRLEINSKIWKRKKSQFLFYDPITVLFPSLPERQLGDFFRVTAKTSSFYIGGVFFFFLEIY